jgi:CBS domain-containing protein
MRPLVPRLFLRASRQRLVWPVPLRYAGEHGRFEAVVEQHLDVSRPLRGPALLAEAEPRCQLEPASGSDCRLCANFLNARPDRDHRGVTLRCLFVDDDPVCAVMTPVRRLSMVPPSVNATRAREQFMREGVDRLLVVDGDDLRGVLRRSELRRGRLDTRRIGDVALDCASPMAPIAAVVEVLRRDPRGCVIVDGEQVAGLVTPRVLRAAGIAMGRGPL